MHNTTYQTIATNLITKILTDGRYLLNDKGFVIAHKDDDGNIMEFAAYKDDGDNVMVPVYRGIYADKAANAYIEIVGAFIAIGDATKHFRENSARKSIIDVGIYS